MWLCTSSTRNPSTPPTSHEPKNKRIHCSHTDGIPVAETGLQRLERLRREAAALSPKAAHIALALLPGAAHLPDGWRECLRATLARRAGTPPPLSPLEFDAIRVTAGSLPAYPEWVIQDPDHPAACRLMAAAWDLGRHGRTSSPS